MSKKYSENTLKSGRMNEMTCYHPMIRTETFDGKIAIIGIESEDKADKKMDAIHRNMYKRYDIIPCGKCIGCRLDYSAQWATRIMCEAKEWKENWFITLTYNDENLPFGSCYSEETGEIVSTNATLQPSDLDRFNKSLRKRYERIGHTGIRFYAAGEYGEKLQRPHYHVCYFNLPIADEDKKLFKQKNGWRYYKVDWLDKLWGKGYTIVTELCWETAAYTARYMMKKQKGLGAFEEYTMTGREPPFTRMSRMPGIGANYCKEHMQEIFREGGIPSKGRYLKTPAYFDKLFDLEGGDLAKIKATRKQAAKHAQEIAKASDTRNQQDVREIAERSKQQAIRTLRREL